MATSEIAKGVATADSRAPWVALTVVAAAQVLTVLNATALKVSVDGIATGLGISASDVKTALVAYSIAVAGLTLLGAKIGRNFGPRRVFRGMLALFAGAMTAMMLATTSLTLLASQLLAGAAAAMLLPTLASLVASNYRGAKQASALGWLGALQATSIVPGYLIAGVLGTWVGWRFTFGLLAAVAAGAFALAAKLAPDAPCAREHIDRVGVVIVVAAILFIGLGCDRLVSWGVFRAQPGAPFSFLNVSPALLAIACGAFLVKAFLLWSRSCAARGRTPLIAPELLGTPRERSTLFSMFVVGAIGSGITFLIPLYLEVVQGRNSLYTAMALIPFTVAGFAAAILVLRMEGRVNARRVARYGFVVVATGVALLGATIRNDWSNVWVVLSMILAGTGEGALATHLFNVLASTAPRKLAGDIGPLCGTTSYLAAGVGTALAGALAIGVLSTTLHRSLVENPALPVELRIEMNIDRVAFVSNDHLIAVLGGTSATPEQVAEAVRINTEARLLSLKISFFALAGLAVLALFWAGSVPDARSPPPDQNVQST